MFDCFESYFRFVNNKYINKLKGLDFDSVICVWEVQCKLKTFDHYLSVFLWHLRALKDFYFTALLLASRNYFIISP
jgi:hypothetical protein